MDADSAAVLPSPGTGAVRGAGASDNHLLDRLARRRSLAFGLRRLPKLSLGRSPSWVISVPSENGSV